MMKWQVMIDMRRGWRGHLAGWGRGGDQIPALCFCSAAIKQPETVNLRNPGAVFSLLRRFHFTIINVCFCFHNCAREFVFRTSEAPQTHQRHTFIFGRPATVQVSYPTLSRLFCCFFFTLIKNNVSVSLTIC